jgi:hypothetical protein
MKNNNQQETIERLSSILPNVPNTPDQLFQDQEEDKYNVKTSMKKLLKRFFVKINFVFFVDFAYTENKSISTNNIIDSNNTNINPVTVVLNHHSDPHLSSKKKNFCVNSCIIQICLVGFTIILIIILAVLTGFYTQRMSHISRLEKELQMMNKAVINEQIKYNETIQTEMALRNQIKDFEKQIGISKIFMSSFKFYN